MVGGAGCLVRNAVRTAGQRVLAFRSAVALLSYCWRRFFGLDDECLESFCKAEGRTSLHSYQPADSALWPLPGYADEETRVHLRPATTTAAAGAAGRRRRPLCDLGTGNFTRPPLPFATES